MRWALAIYSPVPFASLAVWNYCRAEISGVIELGAWCGSGSPGLRPHFHEETQVVMVLSGSRAFRVNGLTVMVSAGQGVSIPAGMLHTPLAISDNDTICLNAYVVGGHPSSPLQVFDIQPSPLNADDIWRQNIMFVEENILSRASPQSTMQSDIIRLRAALANSFERVGEIAASFDRSREGFSRHVTRELGIAPHAFRILARLNRARQLLREGQPIAAVAADTGFSDQSHMTRLFRQTFGTTPGLYWRD